MSKKLLLTVSLLGLVCFTLLLSACGTTGQGSSASTIGTPAATAALSTATSSAGVATPTAIATSSVTEVPVVTPTSSTSHGSFAAYVGNSGGAIVQAQEQEYGNSTTIHSAVDRPAAFITVPDLTVPPKARGEVFIQNDSANPQTVISDTPNGFATFTIAPYTTTTLIFTQAGSFRSHLQGYTDVTLTIFISAPYS